MSLFNSFRRIFDAVIYFIICFAGAVVLLHFGYQEAVISFHNSKGPRQISLQEIADKGSPAKWVEIGEYFVDWDRAYVSHKLDDASQKKKVSVVWYPLQLHATENDWLEREHIVLVKTFKFTQQEQIPKGIQKVNHIRGCFSGDIDEYHASLKARLKQLHPGLDLTKTLLLHENKEPSTVLAWIMLIGGLVCAVITILFLHAILFPSQPTEQQMEDASQEFLLEPSNVHRFYTPSGRFSLAGLLVTLITGSIGIGILCFGYSYLAWKIPYITIKVAFYLLFLVLLGVASNITVGLGKIRNFKVALLFSALLGVYAVYSQWVLSVYVITGYKLFIFDPQQLLQTIKILAPQGAWSMLGKISGTFLYIILSIDGFFMCAAVILLSCLQVFNDPFCEQCNEWVITEEILSNLQPFQSEDNLEHILGSGFYTYLEQLQEVPPGSHHYNEIELKKCPSCNRLCLLTLTEVKLSLDGNGKKKEQRNVILHNLQIQLATYERLARLHQSRKIPFARS